MLRSSTTRPDVQLRFSDKEHFFHDLAQMLRSGIPVQRALEHLGAGRERPAAAARAMATHVAGGLSAAADAAGFTVLDAGILAAGEQSGRLGEACDRLSVYYGRLASSRRRALAASAYPVLIFHLAAVLLSIAPAIMDGGVPGFVRQVVVILCCGYAVVGIVVVAAFLMRRAVRSSAAADRAICAIPLIGGLFELGALSRFCLVLSLGIRSADGVLASILRAGRASRSASLEAASGQVVPAIRAGAGFAKAIRQTHAFPADLERAFEVAEATGRLDEEAGRWADIYQDRFFTRIDAFAAWLPRVLFLVVAILVGASIILSYLRSYAVVFQMLDAE